MADILPFEFVENKHCRIVVVTSIHYTLGVDLIPSNVKQIPTTRIIKQEKDSRPANGIPAGR